MSASIARGTLVAFDAATWTALVLLEGSLAEVALPVLETVPAQLLAAEDEVAVLMPEPANPEAGVILGPVGGAGLLSGYLEQAESAAPAAPASGWLRWYADSSQSWAYFKGDGGAAVPAGLGVVNLPVDGSQLSGATRVFVQTHHTALSFADGSTQSAYWSLLLPPGWAGRTLLVRGLWAPSTTAAGSVLWSTEYYPQGAGVTLSATAAETDNVATAAGGVADRAQAVSLAAFVLSGLALGDGLVLRVSRAGANGLDTFTGAARLLALELSVVG